MYSSFYENKKFIGSLMQREKNTEDGEKVFMKALAKVFLLTLKSCFWSTF